MKTELLNTICENVRAIIITEKVSLNTLSALSKVSLYPLKQLKKGESISLANLLKIMDALGYELSLSKKKLKKEISQDPESALILSNLKNKQLHAKRKERNQPTEGHLPARITVRKSADEKLAAISRRATLNQYKHEQDDIFGSSRSGNEIP